jgi:outer membrane autotransporter protein
MEKEMKKVSVLMGALVLLAGSQMVAAENYYVGAQYSQASYEQSNVPSSSVYANGKADPSALTLIGGYEFNQHVALEGRFAFNAGDDEFEFSSGSSVKTELSYLLSVLGKFSVGGKVSPYALVGFSDFELDAEGGQAVEGNGFSFGAGVDFQVSDNTAISLEYVQYASIDITGGGDADLTALSIGVSYSF